MFQFLFGIKILSRKQQLLIKIGGIDVSFYEAIEGIPKKMKTVVAYAPRDYKLSLSSF